jgi:hypothetical protein
MNLIRIVSHVDQETDRAIDRIVAASPRMSKSAVIDVLLSESPRLKTELAKRKPKEHTP